VVEQAIGLIEDVRTAPEQFEPWFAMELAASAPEILGRLEQSVEHAWAASRVLAILPEAYKLYGVPDAEERVAAHRRQAIQQLVAAGQFSAALPLIEQDPDAPPELKAECCEGMGMYEEAAGIFRSLGKSKDALRNYRSIPDLEKAMALLQEMREGPEAAESLAWIAELRQVLKKRPPHLARTITPAEKKFLAALLEEQLDRPGVRNAPVKRK
jgi:hypothetical protein